MACADAVGLLLLAACGLTLAVGIRAYNGRAVSGTGRGPMDRPFAAFALLALFLLLDQWHLRLAHVDP